MDGILITAAVITGVIAMIAIVTYFCAFPIGGTPDSVVLLPVFGDDKELPMRLERLMRRTDSRRVILVDYSADAAQTELCRHFVSNEPDAVFISHKNLEKILAKTFAIDKEI